MEGQTAQIRNCQSRELQGVGRVSADESALVSAKRSIGDARFL